MRNAVYAGRDPSTKADLQALVSRTALGDEEAFAAMYDAVAGRVLRLVQRVLRDRAQSEEVTQEVLIEVWRTAPRYRRDLGTVSQWIGVLAHRRAVDRVRSVEAAMKREYLGAVLAARPVFDEVSEKVVRRLEQEQVRSCLSELTEVQRQVICLAYYDGLTHKQIADVLSVPLGTAKTRLRDGILRLRRCLEESVSPDIL
ncbi:ECF RNA polymerase sigma factor SigK [Streptomyces sp. NPDC048489]|uniref:ECF RNA polymerase sigma factor SigK n=1 Tax=Streptomyces sp. NPDC048489 TaxID=3154504 RepID=UPI00341D8EF1